MSDYRKIITDQLLGTAPLYGQPPPRVAQPNPKQLRPMTTYRILINPCQGPRIILKLRGYRLSAVPLILATLAIPVFCVTSDSPIYASIVGVWAMLGVNLLIPSCRPSRPYLSPYNWALAMFFLQLVVVPANMMVAGIRAGSLPSLPSALSIEYALLLTVLGYVSFSLSYSHNSRLRRQPKAEHAPGGWVMSNMTAIIYLCLGSLGLILAFSLTPLVEYYSSPAGLRSIDRQLPATLSGAAATFIKPFLAFGAVGLWCRAVDARTRTRFWLIIGGVCCACVTTIVFSSYGYNRATIAAPLVCLVAVVNRHVKTIPFWFVSSIGFAVLSVFMVFGQYRGSTLTVEDLANDSATINHLASKIDFAEQLQLYSSGPQFVAYLLENKEWGERLDWGKSLLASLMWPVPVLGKSFRANSSVAIYNSMVYGNTRTIDQPVPFAGELFINLHLAGVILGYAVLGCLVGRVQHAFENTASSLGTFSLQYVAIWLCYAIHTSAMVVSQMFIYFCLPIYGLVLLKWLRLCPSKTYTGARN